MISKKKKTFEVMNVIKSKKILTNGLNILKVCLNQ
jgi:hypothetical protein